MNERKRGYTYISNFHTCCAMDRDGGLLTMYLNADINLLSARDRLLLKRDCSAGAKENRKEGDQSGPR